LEREALAERHMIEITDVRSLATRIGEEIAVSDWFEISQQRIDQFAAATGDSQWIHVDPARAAVDSPFKTTIAHGFLTLSLLSSLFRDAMTFSGLRMAINYGLNRVRFIAPVPSGARVRARITAAAVAETGDSVQVTWGVTVERERGDKPCCVAEWIVRYYPSP
jgi:acyl dehydratase